MEIYFIGLNFPGRNCVNILENSETRFQFSLNTQAPGFQGLCLNVTKLFLFKIQIDSENSEIRKRLLESSFNFKKSHKHETYQLCSVNRSIILNQ